MDSAVQTMHIHTDKCAQISSDNYVKEIKQITISSNLSLQGEN